MRLGTFSPSVLLRVARRSGVLDRHGLQVEEEPVPSSPAQFRSLASGSLDAALTSPDNVVAYRFLPDNPLGARLDARILRGVDRGLGLALYAAPGVAGVADVADLRGRVVGVDVAASGFAFVLVEMLARAGLVQGEDYTVVELGSTPMRLQALLEGRCDATLLNAGNDLRAEAEGSRRLCRAVDVARPYLGTVLATVGDPGEQVRSLDAALQEAAVDLLAGETTGLAVDEAERVGLPGGLAQAYVRRLTDPDEGLAPDGSLDGLDTVVDLRRRRGGAAEAAALPADVGDPACGLVDRTGAGG